MIVVTTPTGQIGQQVLANLLESSQQVRVIVREPSRLDPKTLERVEVVQGSHGDLGVLNEAFAGADCVFWVVPPNPQTDNPINHYSDFTRAACEAIKTQGVKRVVAVSSLGREFGENAGLSSAAFAMDDLIEATGVSYRALRAPYFLENLLHQVEAITGQGTFFLPNAGDRSLVTVATADVALAATKLLLDGFWSGQYSVPVVGPNDLSPNAMARIMSEVLERPVHFQQVGGEAYKAMMVRHGMTEAWAQGLVDMAAAQDQGVYDAESRTSPSTTSFR